MKELNKDFNDEANLSLFLGTLEKFNLNQSIEPHFK
jgi:hypothetical protein